MNRRRSSGSVAALIVCATSSSACDEYFGARCGPGTIERDGVCEIDPSDPVGLSCGPGTREDGELCVPTSTTAGVTCGPGTMQDGDLCLPTDIAPPPGVESMRNFACRANRCLGADVVNYWTRQVQADAGTTWADHDVARTLTFIEIGGVPGQTITFESLLFRVTDDSGNMWDCRDGMPCPGLTFTAGVPVTLTLKNAASNLSRHTLTAPPFYRNVAWWKVETADGDYRAPTFDSFHVNRSELDHEITLFFVPMVSSTFLTYCTIGVMDGSRFAEIADGSVEPNLATGHAVEGMHATITVEDPDDALAGTTFAQDHLADRDPLLDVDVRRSPSWWTTPANNEGRCCFNRNLELREAGDEEYEYRYRGAKVTDSNPIVLYEGYGHPIRLQNTSMTRRHTLTAPQLFVQSVLYRAEDTQGDVRLPYLTTVSVKPQKMSTVYLSPTASAHHEAFCEVGVRYSPAHGAPDLGSGHAGSGMHGPIIVLPETATQTSTGT